MRFRTVRSKPCPCLTIAIPVHTIQVKHGTHEGRDGAKGERKAKCALQPDLNKSPLLFPCCRRLIGNRVRRCTQLTIHAFPVQNRTRLKRQ